MYYLTETDPRGAMGLGGKEEINLGAAATYMTAIDPKTGGIVWKHKYRTSTGGRGASGLLTTAGRLLFGGDVSGNLVAFDVATATFSGIQRSGRCRTPRRRTWWTDVSTSSRRQATRCTRLRVYQ